MTADECRHGTQAAAWVLGTLPPAEAESYAEHLETCATCRSDVARLQCVADALVDAVPKATPPPELRARVIAAVEAEAALFRAAEGGEEPRDPARRPNRLRARVLGGLAAIALLVTGLILGRAATSTEREGSMRTVPGSVTKKGGAPRARAAVLLGDGTQRLVLEDLAPPPEGRVYQAWVIRRPSTPIPTGALFSVPRSGDTRISLPSLRDAERVIVTAEPPRGSRRPTSPPLVLVRIQQ